MAWIHVYFAQVLEGFELPHTAEPKGETGNMAFSIHGTILNILDALAKSIPTLLQFHIFLHWPTDLYLKLSNFCSLLRFVFWGVIRTD